MMQTILCECVGKCAYYVLLADQCVKRFWAPFARENLVAHEVNLARLILMWQCWGINLTLADYDGLVMHIYRIDDEC